MRTFLRGITILCTLAVMTAGANEGFGQGWGWGGGGGRWGDEPAPYDQSPPRPVYGQPAYGGPREPSGSTNPRCRELEAQLTNGSPNAGQDQLPRIENDMHQADAQFQRAQSEADRSNCYEDMFLFGRSLRRSPHCVDLDRQVQAAKATLGQLRAQRDAIARSNSPRGRRDDVVAELARNHCGDQYVHERETQRSHASSIFSFFSNEEQSSPDEPPPSSLAQPPAPGYGGGSSSYRTLCVRECDGFYFPVSNYTSEARFRDDEAKCHSLCASPAELFYHRADQDVDQMVSLNGRPYASMPYAFKNRKVYIKGCSCNAREYSPDQIAKSVEALKMSKRADAGAGKSDPAFARRISEAVQNAPAAARPVAATPAPGDGATPLEPVPQPNPAR